MFSTNGAAGVSITGANNVLEANFIGTDSAGDKLGGGQKPGVVVAGGGNTIGATVAGAANTIAFSSVGVSITGSSAAHNVVHGNFIGTNAQASRPRERTRRGDRRRIEQQGGRDPGGRGQYDRLQRGQPR